MAHTSRGIEAEAVATSVGRAAQLLGVSPRKFWQLVASSEIASFRIGRRRLIRLADLEAFAERKVSAATP